MEAAPLLQEILKQLVSSQRLGVLVTQGGGQPYGSLVAFVATDDLKQLIFATARSTRKYANLSGEPRVAMVIDNRSNNQEDFERATAATVTGNVTEAEGQERDRLQRLYLSKHPYLEGFVSSPACALLRLEVETYYVVSRFQNVMELHMK